MAEFEILTVTTNQDSGKGSLRWALEKTQEKQGKYEIIFKTPEGAKPSDLYKDTNYWIIRLDSPLPHLETSEIYINYSDSKAIVIAPHNELHPQLGDPNDSLLTIGSDKDSDAVVKLNNINFARHKVVGYDGGPHGGGGGLGAGAGMIIAGDVSVLVENSVFQDLEAIGGKGGGVGQFGADIGPWFSSDNCTSCMKSQSYSRSQPSSGGLSSSALLNKKSNATDNSGEGALPISTSPTKFSTKAVTTEKDLDKLHGSDGRNGVFG